MRVALLSRDIFGRCLAYDGLLSGTARALELLVRFLLLLAAAILTQRYCTFFQLLSGSFTRAKIRHLLPSDSSLRVKRSFTLTSVLPGYV